MYADLARFCALSELARGLATVPRCKWGIVQCRLSSGFVRCNVCKDDENMSEVHQKAGMPRPGKNCISRAMSVTPAIFPHAQGTGPRSAPDGTRGKYGCQMGSYNPLMGTHTMAFAPLMHPTALCAF
eukprot:CAMPEP_0172894292 /NCGR_PEP_ID=MMETSP1075-20121228/150569_1 /TAXON_ID=2916 /ORGANISM="Ceratium fusus, Strain PA161109" /LENGTH=126 /DNA_ID=CAMNT_0013749291 /DNA_START=195 /DNA_END=572 /DNA_ORIENTATION=+